MRDELPHPTIKHVVVLMMEGRGFDHLMGWLYSADEQPRIVTRRGDRRPFLGLSTLSEAELEKLANPLPDGSGSIRVLKGARSPAAPAPAPGDGFVHLMRQMWGITGSEPDWKCPNKRAVLLEDLGHADGKAPMTGYALDFALNTAPALTSMSNAEANTPSSRASIDPTEILDTYTPEQLPVLSGLARHYAVCDEWYVSVPGQAGANRAFALAGTSRGMVDDGFYEQLASTRNLDGPRQGQAPGNSPNPDTLPVSTRCVFEVLQQFGFSWKVYAQVGGSPGNGTTATLTRRLRALLPLLGDTCFDDNFVPFDADDARSPFFEDARAGRLSATTWIDAGRGNDMCPASDTMAAEDFVAKVYNALSASPAWPGTLLVIAFASSGGTYDHLSPPEATPSGNDRVPLPEPKVAGTDMDGGTRTQFGFDFARFGPRVPALLVSPRIPQGTIFRSVTGVPFDHASIAASILSIANIDKRHWQLGKRTSKAPTFEHLLATGGSAQGIINSSEALNAGRRPEAPALQYHCDYLFEYVGSMWPLASHDPPPPRYLGPSGQASTGSALYFHPTLTSDHRQAVRFRLTPNGDDGSASPVLNLAVMCIAAADPPEPGFRLLSVSPMAPCVYYARQVDDGTRWQMRILSSRDPRQEVRAGDLVFFVNQLSRPDRKLLPRLLPHSRDSRLLGVRSGEWGLWRLSLVLTPPAP